MDNAFHNWSFRMRINGGGRRTATTNMMLCHFWSRQAGLLFIFSFFILSFWSIFALWSCLTQGALALEPPNQQRILTINESASRRSIADEMSPGTIINDLTSLFIAFDWFIKREKKNIHIEWNCPTEGNCSGDAGEKTEWRMRLKSTWFAAMTLMNLQHTNWYEWDECHYPLEMRKNYAARVSQNYKNLNSIPVLRSRITSYGQVHVPRRYREQRKKIFINIYWKWKTRLVKRVLAAAS